MKPRWSGLVALLLALACERGGGGPGQTVAPSPHDGAQAGEAPGRDAVFIRAEGQGATEDEAFAAAVRALATELLGDPRWLDVVPFELHERTANLDAEALPGGGVKVRLDLTHSEAAAALAAFRDTQPSVVAPEAWRETIFAYLFAHVREHACVRQRALFEVECETGTTGDADAALQALTGAVVLAPTLRGGVPLDATGRPLREPAVLALWNGAPAPGVPLRVEIDDAVTRVHTGEDGRALVRLPDRNAWPERVRVAVDVEQLLGPRHAAWAPAQIEIRSRKIDPHRWSIVIGDDAGATLADGPREAFVAKMRGAGFGEPRNVPGLGPRVDARALRRLLDRGAGDVDMVVLVEVTSAFASRVGGGRVWYEAKGKVRAVNAWNVDDDAFPTFDLRVTASGLGDARAEQAARTKFCADAAEKLAALLAR